MSLVNITSFSKPQSETRGGGAGGGSNVTTYTSKVIQNATYADRLAHTRYIWGQPFDGTKNVDGDLKVDKNRSMSVYGPFTAGSYYSKVSFAKWVPALNATEMSKWYWRRTDVELERGSITISDEDAPNRLKVDIDGIHSNRDLIVESDTELTLSAPVLNIDAKNGDIKANSGYFNNLYDNGTGSIYVGSPMILDEGLTIQGDLTVENLYSQNIQNEHEIKTKDLTVTGNAHFFSLVIDEVKHAGGQIVLSAASFKIDDVLLDGREVTTDKNYGVAGNSQTDVKYKTIYIYQICEDEDGQDIQCQFQPLDHIMCYTANITEDSQFDARSWWTLVWRTAHKVSHVINGEKKLCNVLEIVTKVQVQGSEEWVNPFWGEVITKVGDNCALLGSHNRDRRSAIVMAAYKSFDNNISAPCIAQYENIHNWTLTGCATTYFAKNGNRIEGDLFVKGGEAVEDIIDGLKHGFTTYLHTAWANSADGTVDFSKEPGEYSYIGLCSNFESDDSDLQPEDYKWSKVSESKDMLIPARERLYLAADDNVYLDVAYMTDYFTSQDNVITATIYTYAGTKTTRPVNNVTPDGLRSYTGIIQQKWSEVVQPGDRYCGGTVYLKSPTGEVLDSHSLVISFDANAILQVTDIIKARVTDAEGNINSLVITAKSLNERITDVEGNYNDLLITVDGLHGEIDQKAKQYEDGWIRDKFSQYDVSIDGLSAKIDSIEQNGYDDNWIKEKHHQLDVSIDGIQSHIERLEVDGYDDTSIRQQIADLQVSVDGLELGVVDQIVGCINILDGTGWGIIEAAEVYNAWGGEYDLNNAASLSEGPDTEHGYAIVNNTKYMQQAVTGELKPAAWYTFQIHSTSPDFTLSIQSNVADTTVKAFVCSEQQENNQTANLDISFAGFEAKGIPAYNGFKKYWCSFKTRPDLSSEATLILRMTAGADLYFSMVKLEEGKFASTYDYSPRDREGMFRVSSDEAYIRIRDGLVTSGIDITSGHITLNANNTDVIGNLNLYNADQGFSVFSPDKTKSIQMRNDNLGRLDDYNMSGYVTYPYTISGGKDATNSTTPFRITFPTQSLGNYNLNDRITVYAVLDGFDNYEKLRFHSYSVDGTRTVNKLVGHIELKDASGNVLAYDDQTIDVPTATTRSFNGYSFGYINEFSTTFQGAHKIDAWVDVYTENEGNNAMLYDAYGRIEIFSQMNSISKLSMDGMVVASSNQEYVWWGKKKLKDRWGYDNAFVVRNKTQNLKVDPIGIYRSVWTNEWSDGHYTDICRENDDDMWSDISSTVMTGTFTPYSDDEEYHPTLRIGAINIRSGWEDRRPRIVLPDAEKAPGKIYYIKRTSGSKDYIVTCDNSTDSNPKMTLMNETARRKEVQLSGGRASMWISIGGVWNNFCPH